MHHCKPWWFLRLFCEWFEKVILCLVFFFVFSKFFPSFSPLHHHPHLFLLLLLLLGLWSFRHRPWIVLGGSVGAVLWQDTQCLLFCVYPQCEIPAAQHCPLPAPLSPSLIFVFLLPLNVLHSLCVLVSFPLFCVIFYLSILILHSCRDSFPLFALPSPLFWGIYSALPGRRTGTGSPLIESWTWGLGWDGHWMCVCVAA